MSTYRGLTRHDGELVAVMFFDEHELRTLADSLPLFDAARAELHGVADKLEEALS